MRRTIACVVLIALLAVTSSPAHAGAATDIALGLASFAVFNQFVGAFVRPAPVYAYPYYPAAVYAQPTVVYTQPAVVYTQPAVVYTQPAFVYTRPAVVYTRPAPVVVSTPAATQPTVVQYPHGRYELHWAGNQYVWVWIPAVPAPPPPPTVVPVPPVPPAPLP